MVLIVSELTFFISYNFVAILTSPHKFVLYSLIMYSTIVVHFIIFQYMTFIYILKHLTENCHKYIRRQSYYKRMFLKEVISMQNELLLVGNFISQVYGIIVVKIICSWVSLTLSVYYITLALDLSEIIMIASDALVWNVISLGEIIMLIILCESSKNKVGLF